jgi:predicted RNA binding protein YcfA (HicA-like mRNA interferase family)
MKSDPITFTQYESVLKELGFSKKVIPKSHVRYDHTPSETILLVRLHKPSKELPWHVKADARPQLSERGVIEAEEFEARLRALAA